MIGTQTPSTQFKQRRRSTVVTPSIINFFVLKIYYIVFLILCFLLELPTTTHAKERGKRLPPDKIQSHHPAVSEEITQIVYAIL